MRVSACQETEVVFAAAVREAETAAVSGPLLADANVRLARLAAQREADGTPLC